MKKRVNAAAAATEVQSSDADDEDDVFEEGCKVVIFGLPEDMKAYEQAHGVVIMQEQARVNKVMITTPTLPLNGTQRRIRLPISMVRRLWDFPPKSKGPSSVLSKIVGGIAAGASTIAAGFDAALQMLSRTAVAAPVIEDVEDDATGNDPIMPSGFQFRVVKCRKPVRDVVQQAVVPGSAHALTVFNLDNEAYLKSLTEWEVALYYKGSMATTSTVFGPYEMIDMKNQLHHAAARCGFGLTDPHGPRESKSSCSFTMKCSCGRERTDAAEPKPFVKDLCFIVGTASVKQKKVRPDAIDRIPDYDTKKPALPEDPSRCFSWQGRKLFVLCMAWNWLTEAETFAAYPEVCIIDCQHGTTMNTDGMNCIGIDGNMHNIGALRALVYSQSQEVFRWIFCVAFVALVVNYRLIKVFFTDDDQHMGPVLKLLVGPGKLFPLASYFKCSWHLIRHNIEDTFGKGFGDYPWQARLISALCRVRKCESVEEFDTCVRWMWRLVQGMELGAVRCKLRLKVCAFIAKRLEMAESWVLYYQLLLPTRGGSTTQRVESDQGTSRDAGFDARNSWLLTARRMHAVLDKRRILKREWCDRQMGSSLIRGPTINPDNTAPTLSAANLKSLDAAYLPWSVETFEEQMLLSSICEVRYVGAGEVQSSIKFVVWSSNPHYGAGSDSEEDDDDQMESDESDHDPDKDDNIDDAEQGQEPTHDSKRQKESDAPPEEHPSLDFEPLPAGTRFHWLRLRHVHVRVVGGWGVVGVGLGFRV